MMLINMVMLLMIIAMMTTRIMVADCGDGVDGDSDDGAAVM